jgi:predicted MFS family arabinose efflux permease
MTNAQLGLVLFGILGFCGVLALGAFLGKVVTPGKLVTFAGVIALVAVIFFSVFAAYYFITLKN